MDVGNALVVVAAVWMVIGLAISVLMGRRGHDFGTWLVLGCILGPLAVPLAIERARFHPNRHMARGRAEARGSFDVLAGIDGSEDSVDAVRSALSLFGSCVSTLTLARVLDYDSMEAHTGAEMRDLALAELGQASRAVGFDDAEVTVLYGRPDRALVEFALDNGTKLIVVGARGHGVSETLFGSVTKRLIGGHDIPVFVGPRGDPVVVTDNEGMRGEISRLDR